MLNRLSIKSNLVNIDEVLKRCTPQVKVEFGSVGIVAVLLSRLLGRTVRFYTLRPRAVTVLFASNAKSRNI
jgi:hypothetical protein